MADADVLPVDFSKEKKKKKKSSADKAEKADKAVGDVPAPDFGEKKKKKKSEKTDDGVAAAAEGVEALDLSSRKKKRSKKAEGGDEAAAPRDADEGAASASSATAAASAAGAAGSEDDALEDAPMGGLYHYTELLGRVYEIMREKNLDVGRGKRTLKQPHVVKDGARRVAFTNFMDICKSMNREPEHVCSYLLGELGTEGNLDGNESLVIRGKFQAKNITSILRRYINEYVVCHMCRSLDTNLSRDPTTRLHRMNCETCKASRSVAPVSKGYTAVIRRQRK